MWQPDWQQSTRLRLQAAPRGAMAQGTTMATERAMEGRSVITRPPMRYHGGKWKLAPWIIAHLPAHRVYCEIVRRRGIRAAAQTPRLCRGIQRPKRRCCEPDALPARPGLRRGLAAAVQWTPYSRAEFDATYEPTDDPIERARPHAIASQCWHSTTHQSTRRTGFRSDTSRAGTIPAHDWRRSRPYYWRLASACRAW